ncbi:MAG: hypothetical protein M0019_06510 [Actinomycetota bacterium]|nr:hypothetical protein [Actinomycetota bacterium]
MATIYIVCDSETVKDEISMALDFVASKLVWFDRAQTFIEQCKTVTPDLAVLDMQIGNMGAIAAIHELHLEESGGRMDHVPTIAILDRRADVFIVKRTMVEGFVIKPYNSRKLIDAARAVLDGGTYEDTSYAPLENA